MIGYPFNLAGENGERCCITKLGNDMESNRALMSTFRTPGMDNNMEFSPISFQYSYS